MTALDILNKFTQEDIKLFLFNRHSKKCAIKIQNFESASLFREKERDICSKYNIDSNLIEKIFTNDINLFDISKEIKKPIFEKVEYLSLYDIYTYITKEDYDSILKFKKESKYIRNSKYKEKNILLKYYDHIMVSNIMENYLSYEETISYMRDQKINSII